MMNVQEEMTKDVYVSTTIPKENWFETQELRFRYSYIDLGIFNSAFPWLPHYNTKECIGIYIQVDDHLCPEENQLEMFDNFSAEIIEAHSYNITHDKKERHPIVIKEDDELIKTSDRSYLFIFRSKDGTDICK